ncbi:MAG: hypothetical protein HYT09_00065 [Candidatus Levybacteria bacterium]|nr:hypothetical protein [Candidatus Levybacteria bacterium]
MVDLELETGTVRDPEDLLVEMPRWYGITVGSLTYAAYATDHDRAIGLVFEALDFPRKDNPVPVFYHQHDDDVQAELSERFGSGEQAVRVVPFSIEPWPDPNS